MSIVFGLIAPSQFVIWNNSPFDYPGPPTTYYFISAPLWCAATEYMGGLVWVVIPAPLSWLVPYAGGIILTLTGLPIAIGVWRTGTGHGGKKLIEASIIVNLIVLLLFPLLSALAFAEYGVVGVADLPLIPGMAIVGCYYMSKWRKTGFQAASPTSSKRGETAEDEQSGSP